MNNIITTFKSYLTASDKWLHLAAGFIIAFFVGIPCPQWAWAVALIVGAGKELYDKISKKGTPELWDFIFVVIGSVLAYICIGFAYLIIR
jgi:succinate dehydrogenase/fumarate reductase cytochrome b subunit